MSWESTLEYYRIINESVNKRLKGHHSAKLLLFSLDFEEIVRLMNENKWVAIAEIIISAAKRLEKAGADFFLICTNTIHKVAEEVEGNVSIPLIHIVDETAKRIKEKGLKTVGLLGTKFTMEEKFYKERLRKHGITAIIPEKSERDYVDKVIFEELTFGIIKRSSRENLIRIIDNLISKGAEGIVLGCTELPLIIGQEDVDVPVFDTTKIHAESAVEYALD